MNINGASTLDGSRQTLKWQTSEKVANKTETKDKNGLRGVALEA
jgi:hypothetical protein